MAKRRLVIGGNWKMYKTPTEAATTSKALKVKLINVEAVDVVVCPPATALLAVNQILKDTVVKLGGQNLHWADEGAFTGEISAKMLKDAGCSYVIVGHSERRHVFGERDEGLNKKAIKALQEGLIPIFCVGETLDDRERGRTEAVVREQLQNGLAGIVVDDPGSIVVAYEPVWAIGTGVNATPQQAEDVHAFIREFLGQLWGKATADQVRIQYGGSVKPQNAEELLGQENIDGALVGGASLNADDFAAIIKAGQSVS